MCADPGRSVRPFPSDAELVGRLRQKDEDAFALIVDEWSGGILRLARSIVSTGESATEVVQDTWLAVIRGVGSFEGRSSLKTWVYRIAVNAAKRRAAREGRAVPWSSLPHPDDLGPTVDPSRFRGADDPYPGDWWAYPMQWPSPEQQALNSEIRDVVADAVAALPDRQRVVITLRDIEGHDSDEVCEILDISTGNQRVLLHRARAVVRHRLEDYFAGDGESGRRPHNA
ncbi:sigma-70 family RNA polymerase sigma factor [Actinomadura fulvescens]|uniref:Sigma-70 family RNA polymerase sigma factor n=1 Tax=Actinomadura fulvescens TaxID=46160 RepID=A0ABN3PGB6_9ACTN